MTTNQPNPEAVEAAARVMYDAAYGGAIAWEDDVEQVRDTYRDRAHAALSAALPLLPDVGDLLAEMDRLRAATVKPDRDTIARAVAETLMTTSVTRRIDLAIADAVLASVLPGRTEAQVKAQAWDEGYTSGHSRAMRRMSDEPRVPHAVNPYERGES